ncbi:hypothetical protein HDZ31DRAFT_79364 [Schizophyllum fasciatum]
MPTRATTPKTPIRVAICGGGVGGLVLALALSQHAAITAEVYEAATAFSEIGAGIGIWRRPWQILAQLGLEADMKDITGHEPSNDPVTAFHYRKSDQAAGLDFYTLLTKGGIALTHRADLQRVLIEHLPSAPHCSKRLRSYKETSSGVHLHFADGTTAVCDVLVGADGIRSAVRRGLLVREAQDAPPEVADELRSCIEPSWSGVVCYRAVVPAARVAARFPHHRALRLPMQYTGACNHIITYPISHGQLINVVLFRANYDREDTTFDGPWVCNLRCDFFQAFQTWEPEVRQLLESVDEFKQWAIHTVRPLSSFVSRSGKVALLGDAAHAMQPFQGSGAGQAIEDAYVLASLLGDATNGRMSVKAAMNLYDQIRRPVAQDVASRSRRAGMYYHLLIPPYTAAELPSHILHGEDTEAATKEKLGRLGDLVAWEWQWAWTREIGELDRDVEEARARL